MNQNDWSDFVITIKKIWAMNGPLEGEQPDPDETY